MDAAQLSIGVWHGLRDELLRKLHVLRFVAQVGIAGCVSPGAKKAGARTREGDGERKLQKNHSFEDATRCPVSSRIVA